MPRIKGETVEGIQSVVLTLQLLESLSVTRESVGVSDLARTLGTTKTRVHRHLRTLVGQGYVTQSDNTGRYRIGARLISLGRSVVEGSDLSATAKPFLHELREHLGQSCVLSRVEQGGARIVLALSGHSPIEIGVKPGSLLRFHNSAQGKVILAFAQEDFRRGILQGELPPSTPNTITDPEILAAELDEVRARGWAVAPNEAAVGLNALSAPVFDGGGEIVGALAVVDLVQFVPEIPDARQLSAVKTAANKISAALGYQMRVDQAPPSV